MARRKLRHSRIIATRWKALINRLVDQRLIMHIHVVEERYSNNFIFIHSEYDFACSEIRISQDPFLLHVVSIFPTYVPIRIIASSNCRPLIFIDTNTNYVLLVAFRARKTKNRDSRKRESRFTMRGTRLFFLSPSPKLTTFHLTRVSVFLSIRQWETRDTRGHVSLTSTGDYRACGALHVHHVYIIKSSPKPLISFLDIPAWKRKVSPLDPRRSSVARGEERLILPGRFRAVDDRDV